MNKLTFIFPKYILANRLKIIKRYNKHFQPNEVSWGLFYGILSKYVNITLLCTNSSERWWKICKSGKSIIIHHLGVSLKWYCILICCSQEVFQKFRHQFILIFYLLPKKLFHLISVRLLSFLNGKHHLHKLQEFYVVQCRRTPLFFPPEAQCFYCCLAG